MAVATEGRVSANDVYTLAEVKARLGLGKSALRAARGKGLVVRRVGRRSFIMGSELVAFLESAGKVGQ